MSNITNIEQARRMAAPTPAGDPTPTHGDISTPARRGSEELGRMAQHFENMHSEPVNRDLNRAGLIAIAFLVGLAVAHFCQFPPF